MFNRCKLYTHIVNEVRMKLEVIFCYRNYEKSSLCLESVPKGDRGCCSSPNKEYLMNNFYKLLWKLEL